jgi:hypothetical protein
VHVQVSERLTGLCHDDRLLRARYAPPLPGNGQRASSSTGAH